MVLIAIPGGTSPTLGASIITALLSSSSSSTSTHEPIILSRHRPESDHPDTMYGARIRYVDYTSPSSLLTALRGVHTIISVLKIPSPAENILAHKNLLQAAKEAGVKRFAPSEWEGGPKVKEVVGMMGFKTEIWGMCVESGLEVGRFQGGVFMNYLGQGVEGERKEGAIAGLDDDLMLEYIDVARGRVVVPLNDRGEPARVVMTELRDLGRFVAAACDLESGEWKGEMSMVGDEVTFQQVAEIAERVTGRRFEVVRVTKEDLKRKQDGFDEILAQKGFDLDAFKGKLVAQLVECQCYEEKGNMLLDPVVNQLCPQVKPVKVEEYLERYWGKK